MAAMRIPPGAFPARRQHGMSLVELMVAVSVFSIGMLAVASLQISGLRHTQMAAYRVDATLAAHALIEEMRANQLNKDQSTPYNHYRGYTTANSSSDISAADVGCYADDTDCTHDAIAALNAKRWLEGLEDNLFNGRGIVCYDSTPNDATQSDWNCDDSSERLVVKVGWNEQNPPGSNRRRSWQFVEVEVELDSL